MPRSIGLCRFLKTVIVLTPSNVFASFAHPSGVLNLSATSRPRTCGSSVSSAIGRVLALGAVVTNAVRHAFHGRNGEIRVELLWAGAFVRCKVMDDGSAPAHVERGRGLKIIGELVKALDGQFEQKFGTAGSTSIIVFPCSQEP